MTFGKTFRRNGVTALAARVSADWKAARAFLERCPINQSSADAQEGLITETENLLRSRIRAASFILFLGFVVFLTIYLDPRLRPDTYLFLSHIGLVLTTGLSTILLGKRFGWRLSHLRVFEYALFLMPAAYFTYLQGLEAGYTRDLCLRLGSTEPMTMYSLRLIVPWICVMFIYGSFIPNTWQRCAAHIAPLALIPIAIFAVTCSKMPGGHEVLTSRVMLEMILWLGVPAFTAVFGAHMLSTLRRKAAMAKELGAYFLKQRLGAGGMGEVFLAEHKLLKRPCAIKLIRPNQAHDPLAISRFEREVQATAKLTHWNTIEIFDYGHTEDGTFYYVMEYLPGMSLQDLVDLYGPMPTDRAIHFLTQVCDGLHEAHGMGLIHRDIKPGNVFASYRGGRWDVAKLLDFGLVSSVSREFGAATNGNARTVVGTPLFASPEWTLPDGQLDGRSDIYSLGAVGYFLVTGQPVFTHQSPMKLLLAHTHEAVRPIREINPDVPADFEAVVMKCLAKRPEDRYATALELRRALERTPASSTWTQERAVAWWNGVDTASVDARQESDPGAVTQVFEISEVA